MSENLISYYEKRLNRYLTRVFNGTTSGNSKDSANKILELFANVLRANKIVPSEWSSSVSKLKRPSPSGLMEFIQLDHLLETVKAALEVLDPDNPAFEILKQGLEEHASKISEQQRANASHPREPSPFRELLEEIILDNKNITTKELLKELKKEEGGDVIKAIDYDQGIIRVYDIDDRERIYKTGGLKDHLRKIRDKLI